MIPRIIHYCWFGKKELPLLAKKCIASWKKYMPDCEIIEWNEDNFDVNMIQYTREAYEKGKYAFVSDFARFYILYNYGGIYLDVDVELIKPLDNILSKKVVLGFESVGKVAAINPGLICASEPGVEFLKDMINIYKKLYFINNDGSYNLTTIVEHTTNYFILKGLENRNIEQQIGEVTIFPIDYFCPIDIKSNKLFITENTYSIHHFASSWIGTWGKFKKKIRKMVGSKTYLFLHNLKNKFKFNFSKDYNLK